MKIVAALVFVPTLFATAAAAPPGETQTRPRVVVVLCIPGLRADYFDRFRAHLIETGLRRFEYAGASFPNAGTGLAVPEIGPAYATVATGRWPRSHGIVADRWIDRETGAVRTPVNFAKAFGGPAGQDPGHRMLVATLAEHIREKDPKLKVISVGWNPAPAVLLGSGARRVLWFNPLRGGFWGWPLDEKGPPEWMARYADGGFIERWRGKAWKRLLPEWKYRSIGKDERPEEANTFFESTFPHALPEESAAYHRAIGWTPLADQLVLEVAAGAILGEGLAQTESPALAWVALDGLSSVGRLFGPRSHEALDAFLRLDRQLAAFFSVLDSQFGTGQWAAVLAGLGGMPTLPSAARARGFVAERVDGRPVLEVGEASLPHHGGGVYLQSGVTAAEARAALEKLTAVLAITTKDAVHRGEALEGRLQTALEHQVHADRSGDLLVMLRPFSQWRSVRGPSSPWSYDADSPLMLFGLGVRRGEFSERATLASVAPTVARLLGVTFAAEEDAPVLERALDLRVERKRVGR